MNCLGCRIVNGIEPNVNIVYENELVKAVLDIDPFNEGHTLVLPKKYYRDLSDLDKNTLTAIMNATVLILKVIKQLYQPNGLTICQNGGVFNDLGHFHTHVIPRCIGDGFALSDPLLDHKAEERLEGTKA